MTLSRRLAIAAGILLSGTSGAWAQTTYYRLNSGSAQNFQIGNDIFTIPAAGVGNGCVAVSAGGSASNCSGLYLAVTVTRGVVTMTTQFGNTPNPTTPLIQQTSASNGTASISYRLSVSTAPSTTFQTLSSPVARATGNFNLSGSGGAPTNRYTAVFSGGSETFTDLTASITSGNTSSNIASSAGTAGSGLNITQTFSLFDANRAPTGAGFNITTALLTFTKAPEPVSIAIFAVGLAGLGAVRRARRKAA